MTGTNLRCAHCHKPMQQRDAIEVGVEQGTSANLLYIHRVPCTARQRALDTAPQKGATSHGR